MIKRKKERKKENSHKNKLIEDSSEKVNKIRRKKIEGAIHLHF